MACFVESGIHPHDDVIARDQRSSEVLVKAFESIILPLIGRCILFNYGGVIHYAPATCNNWFHL